VLLARIPGEVLASFSGVLLAAVIYLARQIARAEERIARLEGRMDERPIPPPRPPPPPPPPDG
jgi:hypothetical protein